MLCISSRKIQNSKWQTNFFYQFSQSFFGKKKIQNLIVLQQHLKGAQELRRGRPKQKNVCQTMRDMCSCKYTSDIMATILCLCTSDCIVPFKLNIFTAGLHHKSLLIKQQMMSPNPNLEVLLEITCYSYYCSFHYFFIVQICEVRFYGTFMNFQCLSCNTYLFK